MNVIAWIRKLIGIGEYALTPFEKEHYHKFEVALSESDVVAYVYEGNSGYPVTIPRDSPFHSVTAKNLVSFYKMNRAMRRKFDTRVEGVEQFKL